MTSLMAGLARQWRELVRPRRGPPQCGPTIKFHQRAGYAGCEGCGEFMFQAADIEAALVAKLAARPNLASDHEGAILNWLRARDDSVTTTVEVPQAWWRFRFVANAELRAGRGQIFCHECQASISHDAMRFNDDIGCPSLNTDRLLCPNGHLVLAVDRVHYSPPRPRVAPSKDDPE